MSENPHNTSRQYEDEISLYDLYRILAEKKAILISTIIITLLVATAYLYIVPPIYPAEHMDAAFQHKESSAASLIMSGYLEFSRNQAKFEAAIGRQVAFVPDNHSRSVKNVLRGLHYQIQQPQDKSLADAEHFA